MLNKNLLTSLILLFFVLGISAQETAEKINPGQVTFIYPVGTNAYKSHAVANHFSFNLLWGINGGLWGTEIGGIGNTNRGDVNGVQWAGVINITTGNTRGMNLAGVANITTGNTNAVSLSGVVNSSGEKTNGLLLSGVANITGDTSTGTFISGVANVQKGDVKGAQISTINVATTGIKGFQLGVINYSQKLNGFQLGLVNVCKEVDKGLPFGLINVVKNGYYNFELSTNELFMANLSYKMGVESLYTIFRIGGTDYADQSNYCYGYGLGSLIPLAQNHLLSIEGIASNVVYDNNFEWENLLNTLSLKYNYMLTERIALNAGASYNVYLTSEKVDGDFGTFEIPSTLFEKEYTDSKLFSWIGFSAGFAVTL